MNKALHTLASLLATLALAALATGCSGLRVIDNDVVSFAQWRAAPPPAATSYRFERLPSQQALLVPGGADALRGAQLTQDQLEAMARAALGKVGLVNNPAAAALDVQVSASTRFAQRYPYNTPFYGGGGVALGTGSAGGFVGLSFPLAMNDPQQYLREVSLVMRDSTSHAVVYETRAAHSGFWSDTATVLPAMFDAALQGFPTPPTGVRRVNIEIPR